MLDPDSSLPIIFLVLLFVLHMLLAATKEAIVSIRKSRLLQLIEEGIPGAKIIDRLTRDTTYQLTTTRLSLKSIELLIIIIAITVYTPPLAKAIPTENNLFPIFIILAITMLITLVFGELVPREFGRNYAEFFALRLIYPLNFVSFLAAPLARIVSKFGQVVNFGSDADDNEYDPDLITEDDLRTMMDASEEGGGLKEDEKEMIYSIFNLDDTVAREVMVPRIDMVAIEAKVFVREALDAILEGGHSRLPVYVDNIDNIVGILYAKDLLAHWRSGGEPRAVAGLERDAHYVPETKPVSELLRELQARKVQIAMVVDEYGGVAGLVTIEDILEEIVGEIQDEYDQEEFFMERISDDEFIFSARMDLDDINNIMSIDLPTDESDTLGGLIYTQLGGVPDVGNMVRLDDLRLTVLGIDGRRIKRVKIQRISDANSNQLNQNLHLDDKNTSSLIGNRGNAVPGSS